MKTSHLVLFVLIISFVAGFLVYIIRMFEAKNALYKLEPFTSQCTIPVKIELADGLYRYYCDIGFYTSSVSPEKFQELKANK
ncbi:TPA: hypothetical protein ACRR2I_003980 [Providencia rettgeri]